MPNETEFPKEDDDIWFASDMNRAYYQQINQSTMNYGAVSVSTTATVIKAANASRELIIIRNNGGTSIFIGDSGVTTSDGYELEAGQSVNLFTEDAIYGIVASGTEDARYLEVQ